MTQYHLLVSGSADDIRDALAKLEGATSSAVLQQVIKQGAGVPDHYAEKPEFEGINWPATVDVSIGLDQTGLPWDSRIHSSGKSKLQSGEWRALSGKKAPSDDERDAIIAELRAIVTGGTPIDASFIPPFDTPAAEPEPNAGAVIDPPLDAPAAPPPAPAPEPKPEPARVLVPTGEYTIESLRAGGWSDEAIVAHGHGEWREVVPAEPEAPAAPATPAPPTDTGAVNPADDVFNYASQRVADGSLAESAIVEECGKLGMKVLFDIFKDDHRHKCGALKAALEAR